MFRRFFSALASLTTNAEALAASFAEANERFRSNLALDHTDDIPALPDTRDAANGSRNGTANGRHAKAKAARA